MSDKSSGHFSVRELYVGRPRSKKHGYNNYGGIQLVMVGIRVGS